MLLSVIVVNWNSKDDLARCLESLERQTLRPIDVVVVDNGSTDGSPEMVCSRFPGAVLIAEAENLGFAEGCNRGIAAARGEWIALLNNDAVAAPDWAERLVAAARSAPERCGMLQSAMFFLESDGTINSLGLWLTRSGGAIDRAEGEKRAASGNGEEIFCPTGGAAAYRRSMLDAIRLPTGYLDRDYFCYAEDYDLGWRAQLAGWSARLVSDSVVHHRFHGSTRKRGKGWFVTMTRLNRLRTLIKNASPAFLLATLPYSLWELLELGVFGGPRAFARLPKAVRQSVRMRDEIAKLAVRPRRDVEKRWVGAR
jgi:GT2 family glycosyltransferase